jgi:hypothetical protein
MEDHGAPTDPVEGLRTLRTHTGALAGGEDDCRKRAFGHDV